MTDNEPMPQEKCAAARHKHIRRPGAWAARIALLGAVGAIAGARAQSPADSDWGYYGGDALGQHYSSLAQIDRGNVAQLRVVWTYRTREMGVGFAHASQLAFEATPVLAFGRLYLETPTNIVIALDPATGRELWRYNPHIDRGQAYARTTARGVSAWQDPDARAPAPCSRRIFTGTLDARLIALDAASGTPCLDFGSRGAVNLSRGHDPGEPPQDLVTSPPALFGALVIVGSAGAEPPQKDVGRGIVRAFDARSGALRWSFETMPAAASPAATNEGHAAQATAATGANAWAVMSVDENRGLVFVPTGSASPKFSGAARLGSDRFADSLLALDAAGGRLVWQQQLVHHDLWDYDLAAEPALIDMTVRGVPDCGRFAGDKNGDAVSLRARQRQTRLPRSQNSGTAELQFQRRKPRRRSRFRQPQRSPNAVRLSHRGRLGHHVLGPRPLPRSDHKISQRRNVHAAGSARLASCGRAIWAASAGAALPTMYASSAWSSRSTRCR
jgi:glucose dehydrogenase